jgi:Sigma-70 region 3
VLARIPGHAGRCSRNLGREPTPGELAAELDMTPEMAHHAVGGAVGDYSLVREQSNHALRRKGVFRWTDLGTYGA